MANFKTHISTGAVIGFLFMLVVIVFSWVSNLWIALLLFFLSSIASFLPDIDSDTGKPIRIVFAFYAFTFGGLTAYFAYKYKQNIEVVLVSPIITASIIWFPLARLFKKITVHRGIFHSTPAGLLSFFITLFLVNLTNISNPLDKLLIASAVGIGYFSHLILDEIYSTNILKGSFRPKKSLGTALKFRSKNTFVNVITYLLLIISLIFNLPFLLDFFIN